MGQCSLDNGRHVQGSWISIWLLLERHYFALEVNYCDGMMGLLKQMTQRVRIFLSNSNTQSHMFKAECPA